MKVITYSPLETKKLGELLAKEVLKTKNGNAVVVALEGNLGGGKTTFIQGFAEGLKLKNKITSPTFLIFRHYKLQTIRYKHFFHMDAYRIKKLSELEPLGFKKILSLPRSIVLIEWGERIKKALPKKTRWLEFRHGRKENERVIKFKI
ncbi:MAG: tRNA (adenosine(37)-N6)-threonylcarbamoyltransferase complex ATPase subunit type 1 TsaE [Patescibacteria group bacterium]